jgi:hypothetical protein
MPDDAPDAWEIFELLGTQSDELPPLSQPGVLESLLRSVLTRAIEDDLDFCVGGPSPEEQEDEELRGVVAIVRRALERRGPL